MPQHPTQLRVCALGERGGDGVFVGRGVQANLDQLVVGERRLDGPEQLVREARFAHSNEGAERVRPAAQEAALEASETGTRFVAHSEHSKEGRGLGRLPGALAAFALCFGVACANSTLPAPDLLEPTPRSMSLAGAHAPLPFSARFDGGEPAPLLDPAPPGNASLSYVRSVLATRGMKLDGVQREGVARALVRAEADHGISVLMTLALITQESRFDPRARGPSGSLGLMQLQPTTARDVARRHGLAWQSDRTLLDAVQNVRIGVAYLAELRERFGSTDHAMAAYNIGPGNLVKLLKKRPLRHGPYLKKVHGHASSMEAEFGTPETAIGG